MSLFRRRSGYDRKHLLRQAREMQRRGRHKKAVALLRQILIVEPNNSQIHAMIAPSLASHRLEFSAWVSYSGAATEWLRDGKKQLALDCYLDATQRMPRHYQAWTERIAVQLSMGRRDEAKASLEAALAHFRRRATRHPLISLLRRLLELDPGNRTASLELAYVLSKTGQKQEALILLTKLAEASTGPLLRQVRRLQWNVSPSLMHSWRWLCACMARA
jgi:tetratricopeptide (TPR) repeat protein